MQSDVNDRWPQPYRLLDAQPYWEGLAIGQLKFQRCAGCRNAVWPPKSCCPYCDGERLEWQESSGKGAVYSFSTVMRGPTATFAAIAPYTVGFVEMDDGYFLFAQIGGAPEAVRIGSRAQMQLMQRGDQQLPIFALLDAGQENQRRGT